MELEQLVRKFMGLQDQVNHGIVDMITVAYFLALFAFALAFYAAFIKRG